jgi:hypothetical protein
MVYVRLGVIGVDEGIGTHLATIDPDNDITTGMALADAARKAFIAALADLQQRNTRHHEEGMST